jgi:hypothetical protein
MEEAELREKAMGILKIPTIPINGRSLKDRLPEIVEHLVNESFGKSEGKWLEHSARVLSPRHMGHSTLYAEEIAKAIANMTEIYEYVKSNGRKETPDMVKFYDYLRSYKRILG